MNKIIPALAATIIAGALALSGASVASAIDSTPITPGGTPSPSTSTSPVNTPAPTLPSTIPLKVSAASGQSSSAAVTVPLTDKPTSSSSPTPVPSALPAVSPVVPPAVSPSKVTVSPKPIAVEVPTLVLWEKPATTFGPQHVVASKSTADLNALDADALAGHCYQADLYHPSDITGNLLEGGTLIASNNPKEDLLPGGPGVAYKAFCVPALVIPTVQRCEAIISGGTATDLNANGWTYTETRSTGHNDYVAGGLHVYTSGTADENHIIRATSLDKAAGYHALGIPLKLIGTPALELASTTGGLPGMNLAISLHGDGVWNGIIVNEGNLYGAGMWWTSKTTFGVPAGGGYPSLGTLNQYLAANPNATVLYGGYSLGSGVLGNVVIKSETMGCKKYTFDVAPTPAIPTPVTGVTGSSKTDCTAKTVTTTTVTTTSNLFHLDGKVLVADKNIVTTKTTSRPATAVECPVVVTPPVVTPPVVTPPTPVTAAVVQSTPAHKALAFTGPTPLADATQLALLLSGIILLGAGIPMTIALRKRANRQE